MATGSTVPIITGTSLLVCVQQHSTPAACSAHQGQTSLAARTLLKKLHIDVRDPHQCRRHQSNKHRETIDRIWQYQGAQERGNKNNQDYLVHSPCFTQFLQLSFFAFIRRIRHADDSDRHYGVRMRVRRRRHAVGCIVGFQNLQLAKFLFALGAAHCG